MRNAVLCIALLLGLPAAAQIQDNSFLVEEAYNQDPGVVQHISTFQHGTRGSDWVSTFTQEWPAGGVRDQLSYMLTAARAGDPSGFGDVALNYRRQVVGDGEARIAFAPRLSVVLPTGDSHRNLGAGSTAFQLMLPVSVVAGEHFVTHWNAGVAVTPAQDIRTWTAAQSVVWLAHPRFNTLVETVWSRTDTRGGGRATSLVVSPGIRWSYDLPGRLQIVPGIAVPVSMRSPRDRSVLTYLSFEHPFARSAR